MLVNQILKNNLKYPSSIHLLFFILKFVVWYSFVTIFQVVNEFIYSFAYFVSLCAGLVFYKYYIAI